MRGGYINNLHKKLNPRLAPTERPALKDIYWAAGIYEGEGSCHGSHRSNIQCRVGQKDRWLCDRLRALFGGHVCATTNQGKPFYNWAMSGARARGFLMTIYTLMSPRRQDQIVSALRLKAA